MRPHHYRQSNTVGFSANVEGSKYDAPKKFAETNHFRFGNGQHEMSTESIIMPIILGGREGSIKAAIIQGTAPLLISRSALKSLKASLHFGSDELELFDSGKSIPLQTNSANQYIVNVLDDAKSESKFEEIMMTSMDAAPAVDASQDQSVASPTVSGSVETPILVDDHKLESNKMSQGSETIPPPPVPCRNHDRDESTFKPSRKQARKLCKQFQQCCAIQTAGKTPGKKWFVVEVFSPPRFAKVVEPLGHKAWSIDLETGYDLKDPQVRAKVKEELAQHPPELLILCPPCTNEGGWSNYNKQFLSPAEFLRKRNESRLYIKFCCELFRQQVSLGGRALFEHPAGARTWRYPEMLHIMQKHEVVNLHMCRYNLKLPNSEKLIRKSTRLVASHPEFQKLAKKCPGQSSPEHQCHQVIEGSWPGIGQVSKFCAKYTPEFVKAVLELIPSFSDMQEVLIIDEVPVEHRHLIGAVTSEKSPEPSDAQVDATLEKLHRNLGHPPNHDLVRILKNGMASEKAIARARDFMCPFCQSQKQPKVPLPAQTHRVFDFNDQVGIDVKHLPGWQTNQKVRALNIVDQASCYQRMIPFFETETAQVVRDLYAENWIVWAGPPRELVLDPSNSNLGENMVSPTEMEGTFIRPIAAEAHWQLGRTERHGGYFEKILSRLIEQFSPRSKTEWLECVRHAHVKNQMIQSYGFTPHQYVFGKSPHIPGDLLNEPLHVVPGTASLEVPATERAQALRTAARKAVLELQDDRSLRKALAARPRVAQPFKAGDQVAYWRQQKWIAGQLHQGGRWYGTAIVIGYVGRNLVLAHRKQILRCAPEQVRYATTEERTLLETSNAELLGIKDIIAGGAFKSNQFVDLTPCSYPTQAESIRSDTPVVAEPPTLRNPKRERDTPNESPSLREEETQPSASTEMPTTETRVETESPPMEVEAVPPEPVPAEPSTEVVPPLPSSATAPSGEASSYGPVRRRILNKNGPSALFRPPAMAIDDFAEVMREVVPQLIEETMEASRDKRPLESVDPTAEPASSRPRTESSHEVLSVQQIQELNEDWIDCDSIEVFMLSYLQKKSKELNHSNNEPALQEQIDDSKVTEWQTLISKGAVKVISGRQAEHIKEKLSHRFIGSRFVIVRKGAVEGQQIDPTDPNTYRVKSRWCLQGHLDPDLDDKAESGLLQSPTLSQLGRNTLMQLLASNQWQLQLGDIKGAFLEAGELPSKYRPLYAKMPPGGIPGIAPNSVIEVVGNVYGQNDAPVAWYRTFDQVALSLGWQRSKFDNCLYYLRDSDHNNQLCGIMGVHVDDTAVGGQGHKFESAISALKKRFSYRKWRIGEGEFCGAYYKQCPQTGAISMNQSTFAENLKPANITRGTPDTKTLNESQIRTWRAINGSLNWLSSQSRPDLAAQTSISQQSFPRPTIRHLRNANNIIRRAKQHKELSITYQPIPMKELTICCHSDAAWANVGDHTQAGYVLAFTHQDLQKGFETVWNPVAWRSYRLPRAASSTLAAESQAMATATGTAEWLSLLLCEAIDGPFELRKS